MSRIQIVEMIYSFGIEKQGGAGLGRFVSALSGALDPRRFEVAIGALWNTGTEAEHNHMQQLAAQEIQVFTAADWDERHPYLSFRQAVKGLHNWLAVHPAQILHSHSEFSDVAILIEKIRAPRIRALRTVHYGFRYEWRKRPLRRIFLTHLLYPLLFDAEIGVSRSITDVLDSRPAARLLRRRGRCIYNAIDLGRFENVRVNAAEKKRSLGIPPEVPLIGSIGRLTEQKGYCYWIEAAALTLQRLPQARFILIGEGELEAQLKDQARRLGIDGQITFTGPRADVEELLACMDLFVSSSLWEGLPTVVMESMACGLPVVATDIPGSRDLVQPGVSGWLAPPADPRALSQAILEAMGDPQARRDRAARAREQLGEFSIQAVAEQYSELYQSLIR